MEKEVVLNRERTIDKFHSLFAAGRISGHELRVMRKKLEKYSTDIGRHKLVEKIEASKLRAYHPDGWQYYLVYASGIMFFVRYDFHNGYVVENTELAKAPTEPMMQVGMPLLLRLMKWGDRGWTVGLGIRPSRNFAEDEEMVVAISVQRAAPTEAGPYHYIEIPIKGISPIAIH